MGRASLIGNHVGRSDFIILGLETDLAVTAIAVGFILGNDNELL
jgi:hypothetical protein